MNQFVKFYLAGMVILACQFPVFPQGRAILPESMRNIHRAKAGPVDGTENLQSISNKQPEPKNPGSETIGETWYDLQSNASMQNRLYLYPDGFIGATFTFGMDYPSFPERGTGYNHYENGDWYMYPLDRIESDRCGWPSYAPWGSDGEMVVAHYSGASTEGLVVSKRTEKGSGNWTESGFSGPDGHALLWPRMVTSGDDNETVHLMALTAPLMNGGNLYQGQDGALVYSRSSDGGATWDIENVVLDGLGSAYYNGFEGDTYEFANPGQNTLAIIIGNDWTDLILMKSTDNGDTWEKTLIWEHPYPLWNYTATDTFYCPDGAHAVVIDNAGKVHVAFGLNRAYSDGATQYWFPLVDGVAYWNEDMATFSNAMNALSPYGDSGTELTEDYNLIGWMQDVNGNGILEILYEYGTYYLGASSMPQLVIDEQNQLFLVYASITETYDNGIKNYRHLWARGSPNNGANWGDFVDLNSGLIYIFSECVFPSCSPSTEEHLLLIFQEDNEPGMAARGDLHPYSNNYISFISVPKEDLVTPVPGNTLQGTVTDLSSGNPIPYAQVTLEGTTYQDYAASNGFYIITGIPAGTYTAICERPGYLTAYETVVISNTSTTTQNFILQAIVPPQEAELGGTRYDLQTNFSMQNRFYSFDDGAFGAVWTMGAQDPFFPDRGTGYAYYNGASWDPVFPDQRIESVRTGWPCYMPWGAGGEMVVSHDIDEGELVLLTRSPKGTGDWNEMTFSGPQDVSIAWNRTITAGADHEILHLLAITLPVANGGALYQGLDGAILYSRSEDAGNTWEQQNIVLNGMSATGYTGFQPDQFEWADPAGNNIAFLVGGPWTNLFLMKSDDQGLTWQKEVVWDHPYPLFDPAFPTVTDTFYCPDGAHHLAFDSNGKLHVVFGITRAWSDGNGIYLVPEVDGIGYWNEDMEPFSNDLNALSPYGDPGSELVADESLIAWVQDLNGNGQPDILDDWGDYYLGMSSMPQLVIDADNNLFLIYSSLTEGFDNASQNFRHIWARAYHAESQSWGEFHDLTGGLAYVYGECVFPSCAPASDESIHMVFMEDTEPGLALRGDFDPYGDNSILYKNVLKSELLPPAPPGSLAGQVTAGNNGNPLENALVSVMGTAFTASSNDDGYYLIEGIPVGEYSVSCSSPGFNTGFAVVEILSDNITVENFQLYPLAPPTAAVVGETWYDLQSNSGMQNRIYAYSDGTIGAAYTMGFDYPSFPERGTGYNYYDGATWGTNPTIAIEEERTGWPSYAPWGENGEIVVAHYSGAPVEGLVISSRENKGTGAWNSIDFYGPDNHEYIWPRSATGGIDHIDLHVVALTLPSSNGGSNYQGMDGALLYSRSPDGGLTWDHEHVLPDGINNNFYMGFSADSYEIQAKGDLVAIVAGDEWTGLVLLKSTDNGDTWEKTVIWEHPYPLLDPNGSASTENYYSADGAHCLAFDPTGKVHVAFGITRSYVDYGLYYWFPEVDGIGYWNEDMPAFSNDLNALSPYGDPGSEMIEDYNLIGWSQDVNGNGQLDLFYDWGEYYCGLSSMPQLVIDDWNRIYLVYSSVTETYDNGEQNYRHLWARASPNGGQNWGDFVHLTSDLIYIFSECVFPSCSQWSDEYIYLLFQEDNEPGMAVRGDSDPYGENRITFMAIQKEEPIGSSGHLAGTVTDINSGLPVSNATVQLPGTFFSTVTLPDGTYAMNFIPVGTYEATCSAMGYYNATGLTVEITTGNTTILNVQLAPATGLDPPQNLEVEMNGSVPVLTWVSPASGSPQHYNIYRDEELIGFTGQLTYADVVLEPGTYEYFVTAVYWNGESGPSNTVTIYAPPPCDPPLNVVATVMNDDEVLLIWDPPAIGNLLGYNIFRDGELLGFTTNFAAYYTGVLPGTYEYCVTTVCEDGESEPACAGPVTVGMLFPPPYGLEAMANDVGGIDLNWNPPDTTPLGYRIYFSVNAGSFEFLDFTTDTSYQTEELDYGYWCFKVSALYDGGESETTNTACDVVTGLLERNTGIIQVFPNPADEFVTIASQFMINRIKVIGLTGVVREEVEVGNFTFELSLASYKAGIYFFEVDTDEGRTMHRVIVE